METNRGLSLATEAESMLGQPEYTRCTSLRMKETLDLKNSHAVFPLKSMAVVSFNVQG